MITQLDLHFFKCFEILRLPIAPLTLLSGSNASGKSSVLQAFVLLHQTIREHEWSRRLMLNGKSIRLGTVSDVIDKVNGRRTFEVGIKDG
ncbi:MAG: AAA family ATPase, partial [Desulfobacteraceae bacterium]|nr:AAA family ATPase [Desulfobacteraceae bacterium]MBC2720199.1 AAA family ATPase [Desulfobacteraceae bacterium]